MADKWTPPPGKTTLSQFTKEERAQYDAIDYCYSVVLFRTERKAYTSQFNFLSELLGGKSCYGKYISSHSINGDIIRTFVTNEEIIRNKGLAPWAFDKVKGYNPDFPEPPNPILAAPAR